MATKLMFFDVFSDIWIKKCNYIWLLGQNNVTLQS